MALAARRVHFERIDSTNAEALRIFRATPALKSPVFITADTQSAGRGRRGRRWESPAGGLWASLLYPTSAPPAHYANVALVIGLAVAEAVEALSHLHIELKWPNDLLLDGRKLAGILCESERDGARAALVVGVGVNANVEPDNLGTDLRYPATSLQAALGAPVDLHALRESVDAALIQMLAGFDADGLAAFLPSIRGRLAFVGRAVVVSVPQTSNRVAGRLVGIDDRGHLQLETSSGLQTTASGELSLDLADS